MSRPPASGTSSPGSSGASASARDQLLLRALAHVAEHGFRDMSLRELAAAIGTSHRMLIYHFGTKEELFVELIRGYEQLQRAVVEDILHSTTGTPAEMFRKVWREISAPKNVARIRLYFMVYGQALQVGEPAAEALDALVTDWLAPMEAHERARGIPAAVARANVRASVAMMRGLLLDLVATGDRRGVNAAMERFIEAFDPDLGIDPA